MGRVGQEVLKVVAIVGVIGFLRYGPGEPSSDRSPVSRSGERAFKAGDVKGAADALAMCDELDAGTESVDEVRLLCAARLAEFLTLRGDLEHASSLIESALERARSAKGLGTNAHASLLSTGALVADMSRDTPRAEAHAREALSLGPTGVELAVAHLRMGGVFDTLGDQAGAEREMRLGLGAAIEAEGDRGSDVALALLELGKIVRRTRPHEAIDLLRRSSRIYGESADGGSPLGSDALGRLGLTELDVGDVDGGLRDLSAATEWMRSTYGPDSPYLPRFLWRLSNALRASSRLEDSERAARQCLASRNSRGWAGCCRNKLALVL